MKDEELWLKKIKQKLGNYSEPVPPLAWKRLEKEMTASSSGKQLPLHARWKWIAAAVAFVAVSVIAFRLVAPESRIICELPADPVPIDYETGKTGNKVAQLHTVVAETEEEKKEAEAGAGQPQPAEEEQVATKVLPAMEETPETALAETSKQEAAGNEKNARSVHRAKLQLPAGHAKVKKSKGWSFGISVGNPTGFSSKGGGTGDMAMSDGIVGGGNYYDLDLSVADNAIRPIPKRQKFVFKNGMPKFVADESAVVAADHKQPVSVGISVRKELPKGFSVETGLVYTYLASDVQYAGSTGTASQKLHYLGIPLRANWTFWGNQHFTTYVAGGGTVEKCVHGEIGGKDQTVNPLQFSLMGGVGAQVNLGDHVGLYVEPGFSYFFDDGSDVQTIRKDNPFDFTLQAGLRFTY